MNYLILHTHYASIYHLSLKLESYVLAAASSTSQRFLCCVSSVLTSTACAFNLPQEAFATSSSARRSESSS